MNFTLECEREDDGRWLAEVAELPGALAYGSSANEAMAKAEVLALRVLAEPWTRWSPPHRNRHLAARSRMSQWPSSKARRVFAALLKLGAAQAPDVLSPHAVPRGLARLRVRFHDDEEFGPRMLARIAKHTGLACVGFPGGSSR